MDVPPPTEYVSAFPSCIECALIAIRLKAAFNAYDEILRDWCFALDQDSFEHTGMEAANFVLGPVRISHRYLNLPDVYDFLGR